ncbi:unnamed protein product [Moneuplotes crassus]|uniref:Uncharacterized protein n=1 Tax=Euplotes crassus TaxID=5936 RepID=A0AAD2CZ12_EUPCR|nr:unnamed protein product [Moneuplotes crassus]
MINSSTLDRKYWRYANISTCYHTSIWLARNCIKIKDKKKNIIATKGSRPARLLLTDKNPC